MCHEGSINLTRVSKVIGNMSNQIAKNESKNFITLELVAKINIYYMPILIIFGILGNLISVYVFYTSKLRLQSTSVYLGALAVSDSIFLLQLVPAWLEAVGVSSIFVVSGFCHANMYISYVSCSVSAWIVVAFTVERFVAVLYPLRRSLLCTVYRAKYIVLAITSVASILNAPVLRFVSAKSNCSIDDDYLVHAARFNIVDTALVFTLPLTIIIILNSRIMSGVLRLERARNHLVKVEVQRPRRATHRERSHHRVTRMLLLVSSVFVLLNLPAYTMRILAYTYDVKEDDERWSAYQQLVTTFFNTNFGINFMLYCLSGQNFRRALYMSFPCLRRRAARADAARAAGHPARASSISTSFASAGADALNTVAVVAAPAETECPVHRQYTEPIIQRWTFDNSRQRQKQETIEMNTYGPGVHTTGARLARTHITGTHSAGTHSVGTHSAETHTAGTHSAGRHSAGTHSAGTHNAGTHSAGTHSAGTHSAGTHNVGTHSVGTNIVANHSSGRCNADPGERTI